MIIKQLFEFVYWKMIDLYRYIKDKQWNMFNGFGMHIYVGMFGSGKTSSMVYDAYCICKQFQQVTVLTNMTLCNFPKHTRIIKLTDYQQIITAPPNTLILLDEISSIFNSRDWSKKGIPAPLLSMLLQVRKERKMIYATAQRFIHVDALFRQITFSVRDCDCFLGRWNRVDTYDGYEYEQSNVMRPAELIGRRRFIQSDRVRHLYDTMEMVNKMKTTEFISDKEILEKQGNTLIQPVTEKRNILGFKQKEKAVAEVAGKA